MARVEPVDEFCPLKSALTLVVVKTPRRLGLKRDGGVLQSAH